MPRMTANTPVDRGPAPVARLAEQCRGGWRWADATGVVYQATYARKLHQWTARTILPNRPGGATVRAATLAQAIAAWPLAPRAVYRRTLRPHGLLR